MMNSYMFSVLLFLGIVQEPCPSLTIAEQVESADLVAIVTVNKEGSDFFEGTDKGVLTVKRVFKGRVKADDLMKADIFIENTDHVIEIDTEYLIFVKNINNDHLDNIFFLDKCAKVVELGKAASDVIDYLEERWISKCYSKELEDKMKGKHTRSYDPFCGCDGKTYQNFDDLQGSGITQYYLRECKD